MLTDDLEIYLRIHDTQKKALKKLGIETVRDLLYHFPTRYEHSGDQKTIAGVIVGEDAVLYGTLHKPEARIAWKSRKPMSEATLEDGTGSIKLMWFNQPYIAKMFPERTVVKISGKVEGKSSKYIANPEIERVSEVPTGGKDTMFGTEPTSDELFAIYPEVYGITSRWFRHAIAKLFRQGVLTNSKDCVPEHIVTRYNLPPLENALVWIHQPKKEVHYKSARKRFAFEEVFLIQVAKQRIRHALNAEPANAITRGKARAKEFIQRLPFRLTEGQRTAIDTILADMEHPPAMSRLLEGDVGSGKTAIAGAVSYAVVKTTPKERPSATLQVAYMAPTEILAEQHFASFVEYFGHMPIQLGLITSSGCKKFPSKVDIGKPTKISKTQLLKWVANGEIAMVIGTHSLIQKNVSFRDLGLVIIDEQHRFGTAQRKNLARGKSEHDRATYLPHLLSMTATPIPRTLALTLYGDLDLTVLDEMPPGRKPVITSIVKTAERATMYANVRVALTAGRQAYVICPRIEEPDPKKAIAIQTRSVEAETARLRRTEFKDYRVEMLHGQMKPAEKEAIMRAFLAHDIDVLVATSVIEVGVNVQNATNIIIEGAERFGLAQLHQLRGRVVRSTHQAYCYVLTSDGGANARLRAFAKAKNGFELAEQDLKLRGPGELYGRSQSGLTDVGMEALKNLKLVEAARDEARALVDSDPTLTMYPLLATAVQEKQEKLHFE